MTLRTFVDDYGPTYGNYGGGNRIAGYDNLPNAIADEILHLRTVNPTLSDQIIAGSASLTRTGPDGKVYVFGNRDATLFFINNQ